MTGIDVLRSLPLVAALSVSAVMASGPSPVASAGAPPPAGALQDPPAYNGRFRFNRIQYSSRGGGMRGFGFGRGGRGGAPWAHDAPYAETNFAKILDATTLVGPNLEGRYTPLEDPALFEFPIAFIVEVGYWSPSDEQAAALRAFLLKGGFLIVDDFRGRELRNFEYHMRRVLPEHVLLDVPDQHEIFDAFFRIEDPEALTPPYGGYPPIYMGYFEDNDPTKRLMVMLNVNNDHMEYWEFSDRGYYPIDLANDAYKFGVNYVIYAMTH